MMDFRVKFEWGDPFYAIFINNFLEKGKDIQFFKNKIEDILPKMIKFVLKNSETHFQKAETRFQNAETR